MKSQAPFYDLDIVRQLAREGEFLTLMRANRDSRNLSYFHDDISQCISQLTENDFFKIVNYSEKKVIFDVYKTRCTSSTNEEDYLYLKLRIAPDNKLLIGSFKRV